MTADQHYAYESESGLVCCCPTTGMAYTPLHTRIAVLPSGERYVTTACRFCDQFRRTRMDRAFDPSRPQPHMHIIRSGI